MFAGMGTLSLIWYELQSYRGAIEIFLNFGNMIELKVGISFRWPPIAWYIEVKKAGTVIFQPFGITSWKIEQKNWINENIKVLALGNVNTP